MTAPRIGLFVIDGVTLAQVTPMRDSLERAGADVIIIVPTGGSILPVGGRYFPGAGGHGARRALLQLAPADLDLLLLPDGITGEQLAAYPKLLEIIRGTPATGLLPVCQMLFMQQLLARNVTLTGLARCRETMLSGATHAP